MQNIKELFPPPTPPARTIKGDILAIGVDSERPIDITTISTAFKCPLTGDAYRLLGIVGYNGPMDKHRRGPSNGHYTAFVQRNDVWTIYDDMQPKGGVRMARKLVVPELLFYGKRTVYRHIVLVARRSCVVRVRFVCFLFIY